MPAMRDWECPCGASGEVFIADATSYPSEFRHTCGQTARLVWKSFGPKGRLGGDKGRFPYFDTGLGVEVTSSKHRAQMAKEIGLRKSGGKCGLEIMGRDEFTRTANNTPDRSDEVAWDRPAWRDAAEKAWNDLKYKRVSEPSLTTMEDVSADLIDTEQPKT